MDLTTSIQLDDVDRAELTRWLRTPTVPNEVIRRAQIILLAGDGLGTTRIRAALGVNKSTIILWKRRFAENGLAGLHDQPRPGRPAHVDEVAVVLATLLPPPKGTGARYWTSRLLAEKVGISHVWV